MATPSSANPTGNPTTVVDTAIPLIEETAAIDVHTFDVISSPLEDLPYRLPNAVRLDTSSSNFFSISPTLAIR